MENQHLPLDSHIPKCNCNNQKLVRFGECVLCINHECLGRWVRQVANRFFPAKCRCILIANVSEDFWDEYLDYFILHCWRGVAEFNHNGVGAYDISNSTQAFLNTKNTHVGVEFANEEVTMPKDYSDDFEAEHANGIITRELAYLADPYGSPYMNAQLTEVANKIKDPIILFYLAGELSAVEASLLTGIPTTLFAHRAGQLLREVRRA